MGFTIANKIALVTGGASGIGLTICKVLLKNGIKGICMADINVEVANQVLKELKEEFGEEKVIFVKTDVSDINSFENAFKETLAKFKHVDILVNNAGIFNEKNWNLMLDINMKGVLNGMILGLEKYLRLYKQDEGVILNTSSIYGISGSCATPVYTATKHAIIGMTRAWGHPFHCTRTNVRVIAICPGFTMTNITSSDTCKLSLNEEYDVMKVTMENFEGIAQFQSVEHVGEEAVKLLVKAPNGTVWVIENSEPSYQYVFADRSTFKNNLLESRY